VDYFWTSAGGMKSSNGSVVAVKSEVLKVSSSVVRKNRTSLFVDANRVGRPNSLSAEKLTELLKVYYTRPYSLRRLADMFGVSRMTVWRAVQDASMVTM